MLRSLIFGWLSKDTEDSFSAKVDAGLKAMVGNKYFPTLVEQVAACETAYDAYLIAKANAALGGTDLISLRKTARAALVALLRALLSNINAIAIGDIDMLLSTAFPVRNGNRTPIGPLPAPNAPTCKQGKNSGVLVATTGVVYGASLYTAQLALASKPDEVIQTQQQTGVRFEFDGLTPGELYNVSMNAIGAAGASDWSDVGTLRVV